MGFGLTQIALGVVLLAMGPLLGGPFWAFAWPGASVSVVGIAYLGARADVFGKSAETGRLGAIRAALLFPYLAVAWTLWQLKSRLGGEPAADEVAPGILVGRRPLHLGERPEGVRVVVDLTSELPRSPLFDASTRHVTVPTLDTSAPPDAMLARLIDELEGAEGPILFHCAMGHGRSATAAAGLMIRRGLATDVDDAIRKMKAARPKVHLHGVQRAAVRRLHDPAEDRSDRAPRPA